VAEEKKTQMGTTPGRTQRPTGSPPIASAAGTVPASAAGTIPASATGTPAPTTDDAVAASKAKTSYLPTAPDPLLGATVAERYKIIKKLGEGGMGMVYLALHTVLEKQVALKVLHGEFARKDDLVERFMQEAKAASRIRHENVIDISDFGATPDGVVFFAMELLQGHDLHEEVMRAKLAGNLLPWSRSKKIFLQICSALSAAHARGIIHRDLKPENVYLVDFLGEHDFVKLLDFGIAKVQDMTGGGDENARKLTKTGMLFGTPEYMSPEQARGDKVDHRVDIYAMGCILFQLVCNSVPFQAENFMGVLSQHLTEEPPQISPEVFDKIGAPRALADVIDKALLKDRDKRYQTIDEFAAAVREVSGDAPLADKSTKMRAASVPSPAETTRQRPPTGTVDPVRPSQPAAASTTSMARSKTQWTGNLTVPEETRNDDAPAKTKSKLPLILGAVVLIGGGIAAAVVALGGKDKPAGQGSAIAQGSGSADVGSAVVEPPPPPPPVEQLPVMATIAFDSKPQGAQVIDATDGTSYGKTPTSFTLPGSLTARRFKFVLKGYGDSVVELVPNREKIEFDQELVRGSTKSDVAVTRVPDPAVKPAAGSAAATKPDTAVAKPDTQTGSATTKPDTAVAKPDGSASPPDTTTKPPIKKDDCADDELPCLKVNVPGMGSATK
jgi:serine/threonine-protein kinase